MRFLHERVLFGVRLLIIAAAPVGGSLLEFVLHCSHQLGRTSAEAEDLDSPSLSSRAWVVALSPPCSDQLPRLAPLAAAVVDKVRMRELHAICSRRATMATACACPQG